MNQQQDKERIKIEHERLNKMADAKYTQRQFQQQLNHFKSIIKDYNHEYGADVRAIKPNTYGRVIELAGV